jgi:flagellar hook-associated protein 2
MAIESIAKTLGTGSGIDISALVTSLVDAQYAAKTSALTKKGDSLKAQISAVSDLKSSITGFDNALKTLIKTGTLATQPTSSNTNVVKATTLSGGSAAGLATQIEVRQIATAQSVNAAPIADKSAAIGTGKLTLTFGTATVADGAMTGFAAGAATPIDIDITAANNSLTGIAAAINAKNAGVTASILSDSGGSRLIIKGATGATQAFTLTATEDPGAEGLAALNIGVGATGTTVGTAAGNAIVAIDGVQLQRSNNAILDMVPGVRLDLVAAAPGTKITLGSEAPTAALGQAVGDFIDTYNGLLDQLKTATNSIDGPLKSDSAARTLLKSLSTLTMADLVPGATAGTPNSLSGIGVATNRDGTLRVDATRLASAIATYGSNIEAMFKSGAGLSAALSKITTAATSSSYGLGASTQRYTAAQSDLSLQQEKAATAAEALRTRMTKQFAGMDAAVAGYKATQAALTNQIAQWNSSN